MSLFFDYNVSLGSEKPVCVAWSNSEFQPILAVSTTSPRIIFLQEEAILIPELEIARSKIAKYLKWHPVYPALAIGWDDGVITLWNEDDRLLREEKLVHKSAVTMIVFSYDGTRMVTGDINGIVGVWRTHRGLAPICQYNRESGSISHIVFCGLSYEEESMEKWNSIFFFGTNKGSVCLADDLKHCSEVCKVGGHIKSLLFYEKENSVIIITSHLLLVQFKISPNEKLNPSRKVKLSVAGDPEQIQTIWAGPGLLGTCSGENMIRLINIEAEDNYVLTLAESAFGGRLLQDKILHIDYNYKKRLLAGGTKDGYIVMWKCKSVSTISPTTSDGWEAKAPIKTNFNLLTNVKWGFGQGLLCAMYSQGLLILNETVLKKKMRDNFKIIQNSNKALEIRMKNPQALNSDYQIIMTLGFNIKGIDCSKNKIMVWNGKEVRVYEITAQKNPSLEGSFDSKAVVLAIHEDNIVQALDGKLDVCNFKGMVKQTLPMTEAEGDITCIEINNKHMVAATSNNLIKIWDVSRRTWRQLGMSRQFEKNKKSLGDIRSVNINADGSKICILGESCPVPSIKIPDTKVHVYDIEMDTFLCHEISKNRMPVEACWDQKDPRLLVVETDYIQDLAKDSSSEEHLSSELDPVVGEESKDKTNDEEHEKTIVTLFVTSENGIKQHLSMGLEEGEEAILGVNVPHYFFLGNSLSAEEEKEKDKDKKERSLSIVRKPMRDFEGLENIDDNIKNAILNFSVHLAYGNMDEAYNAVRNIKNASVWENMAQMCVKTKRLDVAQICLGNMRFARGARAVREAMKEKELEAKLGMVAIHLNLLDEAKELYKECGRYDLLCKLLEASGDWDDALEIAETHDRINLKTLHYKIAQYYEYSYEFDKAVYHYQKSGTSQNEVPRMYWSHDRLNQLQDYIENQKEPDLYKWWAQYLESKKNYDGAIKYYKYAQDYASLVRICCFKDQMAEATQISIESGDPSACYHLARKYESIGNIREAIQFYSRAQRLHHAVRLAREEGFDNEVMNMSLLSSKQVMLQSAKYFEEKDDFEKAAILCDKGGNARKAMKICQDHQLFELMKSISKSLDDTDDPEVLAKSAAFFLEHGQHDKAVHMLITSKQYDYAIELCEQYKVQITEEMANKITPEPSEDPAEKARREAILCSLAKLCKSQGSFQLAGRKYTQAGKKDKAMKCLLKIGNINAIKKFAMQARTAKIYILGANYLQNADWHSDAQLMKTIISFYTKAKAFEELSGFYDACAQVEIDEYREYEKAIGAMKEALKHLLKSNAIDKDNKVLNLQTRIQIINDFVNARNLTQTNPQEMLRICTNILQIPDVEGAVRQGDVFAHLIEYYHAINEDRQAYSLLQRMKEAKILLNPYIDQEMVDNIYQAMGIKVKEEEENEEEVGEEIEEEYF